MAIYLVPDPTWKGKAPAQAPLMIRADAMRKLYAGGMAVGDVARFYNVTYGFAYKIIKPPKLPTDHPRSRAPKAPTPERMKLLTRGQLEKIVFMKSKIKTASGALQDNPHFDKARVQAAADEMDRRYGPDNWGT